MDKLNKVTYSDFKFLDVIQPDQFDKNFDDVVVKIDELVQYVNDLKNTVAGTSGADNIGTPPLTSLITTTVKGQLAELRDLIDKVVVGAITDGSVSNIKLSNDVKVGSLAALTTETKLSITSALNELVTKIGAINTNIGILNTLTTTDKTTLVKAINELNGNVGILSNLATSVKTSLVGAINELSQRINDTGDSISVLDGRVDTIETDLRSGITTPLTLTWGMNNIKYEGETPIYPHIRLRGMDVVNLLGNDGNFERDSNNDNLADGWVCSNTINTRAAGTGLFGSKSQRYTGNNGEFEFIRHTYGFKANSYYLVSTYAKSDTPNSHITFRFGADNALYGGTGHNIGTSWTRVGRKVMTDNTPPSQFELYVTFGYASSQTVDFDGAMIVEITADEYNNKSADQLLTAYPYQDSYACLTNPMCENRRGNMVINGNTEDGTAWWTPTLNSNVTLSVEGGRFKLAYTSSYAAMAQRVKLKKSTNYYLSCNVSGVAEIAVNTTNTSPTTVRNGKGTFNTGNIEDYDVLIYSTIATAGTGYADSIMLIEGTTAPTSYIPCDLQRFVAETQLTRDDYIDIKDGQVTGQLWWKHRTLFGKDYDWTFVVDYTGYKSIRLANTHFPNAKAVSDYSVPHSMVKYDGKILGLNSVSVGADVFTLHGDGYTYLSIADTDTGWTEAINPNADEVKAYMNGWQAAFSSSNRYVIFKSLVDGSYCPINLNADVATTSNTTTVTLSSNPGFVVGDSIVVSNTGVAAAITGVNGNTLTFAGSMNVTAGTSKIIKFTTAATDYCKANVAPNYAGYQLHYKLATPEPITALNCPISGDLWSLVKGDNYITMDSGIVLGEVANPVLNAGYYQLNNTQFAGSELKNKVDDILYTYRNGISDANWTQTSDGYAIGKEREYCPQAKYDTNATYTVDYKILATIAPQIVSSITLAYPQSVYDSIESIGKAVEGKQDRNNILDMLIDLAQYETLKFEYQGKGVDRTGIGVTFVMTTALTPKITKPIITAKLTTAMFLVGSNSNNLTMSDMQIRRITVLGQNNNQLAVEVAYIGADASVKGYLSSSGVGYFIVDIIADCRGRI